MFKTAKQLPTFKKYLPVLNKSLRRLKRIQSTANAKAGGQSADMMLSIRFFNEYRFDDKGDKKPHPLLIVGTKSVVKKISADLIEADGSRKNKGKDEKPLKDGSKGFVYWNEAETTFHFLVKGPVKLPLLKSLVLRAGLKDKVHLGFASEDTDAKADLAEQQAEELNNALGGEEPDEALPEIGDDVEAEGAREPEAESTATPTPQDDGFRDEYERRLAALDPWITDTIKMGPEAKAAVEPLVNQAREAAQRGDFTAALKSLDALERVFDRFHGAASVDGEAADPGAAFKERLAKVKARYEELKAGDPARAKGLAGLLMQAGSLAQTGDYDAAGLRLDEAEAQLGGTQAATPSSTDPAAEWKARLAEWSPAIKAALAAKGPGAAAVGKLFAQATALSKPGGDMAQAVAHLTECHSLAAAAADWEKALAGVEPGYLQALRDRPDDAGKLRAVMGFAQGKAEKGDYAAARAALQKLAEQLAATPDAGAAPPPAGDGKGRAQGALVALQSSRLAWVAARKKAQDDLNVLRKAVLNEYKGTPRQAEAVAAQAELADVLAGYDTRLVDALDAALNAADPARREELHAAARKVVAEYRAALDGDGLLKSLDANPFVPVKIFGTLDQTLKVLGRQLGA